MNLDFFEWLEEHWQAFVLENLLIAKKLHDKGFKDEARDIDPEYNNFDEVVRILFGRENVRDEPFELQLSPEQKVLLETNVDEEGDEILEEQAANLSEFLSYYSHYKTEIRMSGLEKLWPNQVKAIEKGFKDIVYTLEDWEKDSDFKEPYPYWCVFAGAGWIEEQGKKVGVWFHTVYSNYDDPNQPPCGIRRACELLIRLWDALKVAWVVRLKRKSPFKRLILLPGVKCDVENGRRKAVLQLKRNRRFKTGTLLDGATAGIQENYLNA